MRFVIALTLLLGGCASNGTGNAISVQPWVNAPSYATFLGAEVKVKVVLP